MSLILISAITWEKRKLVYKPATVDADLSPSFSPDGRHLAFAHHIGPGSAEIYLLELPQRGLIAPEARQLTNWNRMNKNPVWAGDGQNILFVGDHAKLGFQIPFCQGLRAAVCNMTDGVFFTATSHAIQRPLG